MNYTMLNNLESQITAPTVTQAQVASLNIQMETFAASACMYLITFYPYYVYLATSNFHGFYYNAAEAGVYFGGTSVS